MTLVESFSGIRGVYGTELTKEIAQKYAHVFCKQILKKNNKPKIVIGKDTRPSCDKLRKSIIKGLHNCEIIDIGLASTPVIENAVRDFKAQAGIIITASHNEPEYNGLKFLDNDGAFISVEKAEEIINNFNKIKNEKLQEINNNNNNKIIKAHKEAHEYYKQFINKIIKTKDLSTNKIIIDPNGGTGIFSKNLFESLKVNADYIHIKPGEFKRLVEPNHKSLESHLNLIKKHKAEFIAGFDCDADRLGILLKDGTMLSGNELLALVTNQILKESDSTTVVVNDATSYIVKEVAEQHKAKFKEVEVGEINVVDEMEKQNSKIGGEGSSGGVIIPPSKCRDGSLTLLYILKIIKSRNKPLREIINELPKYFYIRHNHQLTTDFTDIRNKVISHYKNKKFKLKKTGDETGGLKFLKGDSWIWFRQSKTEDKMLRIVADSKSIEESENLLKEAEKVLKTCCLNCSIEVA